MTFEDDDGAGGRRRFGDDWDGPNVSPDEEGDANPTDDDSENDAADANPRE
ncbi:hypothetical protein [Nocardioides sp. W7]|uniref:hypothetical protein n=1 Tax=Nocardioides sp. W7 TaxID=2931390 RepID=UPI001FD31281|nr:hypothetical protein [Nocardioides sp. W7]